MNALRWFQRLVLLLPVTVGCGVQGESDDASLFGEPPTSDTAPPAEPTADSGTSGDDTGAPGSSTTTTTTLPPPSTTSGPPAGDDTTTDAATGEASATDSSGETGPPGMCDPEPPGMGDCPPECTGGCAGGVCTIACIAGGCNAGVTCPDDWPCAIECAENNTCGNTTIDCGNGSCTIACSGVNSCLNTTVNCGEQACQATCSGAAGTLAGFNCTACSCTNRGC